MPAAAWAARPATRSCSQEGQPADRRPPRPQGTRSRTSTCSARERDRQQGREGARQARQGHAHRRARTRSTTRSPSPASRTARFGWGAVVPGHGLMFANAARPLDAAAAAPLVRDGIYGPMLLVTARRAARIAGPVPARHPARLRARPVRGVYNHGWIIGDEQAISPEDQSRLDSLLEIVPVNAPLPQPPVMSEAEDPARLAPSHEVTVEDVRQLMGASTPHFALQLRNRIAQPDRRPPGGPSRPDRGRARDRAPRRSSGTTGETRTDSDEADDLDPLPSLLDER